MRLSSWALRRQLVVLGIILIVFSLPISYFVFRALYTPPSCFDGNKNQDELRVDCGGSCKALCEDQVIDMIVLWSRSLKVLPGVYDAVALIENPNFDAGVGEISYSFKLFDKDNTLIAERTGTTFINPNEQFVVYEPRIITDTRVPVRTFFEFTQKPRWVFVEEDKPGFITKDWMLEDEIFQPKLRTVVQNSSREDFNNVLVTALLFDKNDNAVAVGKTEIPFLQRKSQKQITFLWPGPFEKEPEVCTVPLDSMLVFDRSGSMNDDGGDPPQPLTDAKVAAAAFIETLGKEDRIGLVSFATSASFPIDQRLTNEEVDIRQALSNITILPEEEEGFTNLGSGIRQGTNELFSLRNNPKARKIMVILTDGKANKPDDPGGEIFAEGEAENARRQNITLYTIGLGEKVNAPFLADKVAGSASRYYSAKTSKELLGIYREIGREVCPERTYPITIYTRVNQVGR